MCIRSTELYDRSYVEKDTNWLMLMCDTGGNFHLSGWLQPFGALYGASENHPQTMFRLTS